MSVKIGVIGAGAWGTALAQALASDGSEVLLWAREAELVAEINAQHANSLFLPGTALSANIRATGDLAEAASRLYGCLHRADASDATAIAIAPITGGAMADAINDRLSRAAA